MILTTADLGKPTGSHTILMDGAFDPMHSGHIRYIETASQAFPSSYTRMVSIASDADIRAKGREPLFDQMTRATVVAALRGVDAVILKDCPTEDLITRLKPAAYVKGKDWADRLPAEQLTACALSGVQIVYLDTVCASSSGALRCWALRDAECGLDRLEAFIAGQVPTPPSRFDGPYFRGDWRADGNTYTYEKRKEIEGQHPELIKAVFPTMSVLDVGCGPGYLVRMLKELGVDAGGCDPSPTAVQMAADRTVIHMATKDVPDRIADVAICREVIEHLEVAAIPEMVCDLFRVARKFVYITTRFSDGSVFDAATDFDTDPTHISLLTQPFLRSLCVLNGGRRRRDLEETLDHQSKRRVLVYAVS